MAKDSNTYAKRQRETIKRQKAEAKRERRRKRKDHVDDPRGFDAAPPLDDQPSDGQPSDSAL